MRSHGNPQQGHEAENAERRRIRQQALEVAFEQIEAILHQLEGTQSGEYGTREMRQAGIHLETAWLWAREAIDI
jgi:hypothetical protein